MRRALLPLLAAGCLGLAGCAPTVSIEPAPQATAVGCASVIVALPQTVGQADERTTNAQGTAAWGTPVSVTLRCGVETPVASGLRCYTIGGVDWLSSQSGDDRVLTTYGRDPGVQVVTTPQASASDALQALSDPVARGTRATPQKCLGDDATGSSAAPSSGAAAPSSSPTP